VVEHLARVGFPIASCAGRIVSPADSAFVIPIRAIRAPEAIEAGRAVGATARARRIRSVGDAIAIGTGGTIAAADPALIEDRSLGDIRLRDTVAPDAGRAVSSAHPADVKHLVRAWLMVAPGRAIVVSAAYPALIVLLA